MKLNNYLEQNIIQDIHNQSNTVYSPQDFSLGYYAGAKRASEFIEKRSEPTKSTISINKSFMVVIWIVCLFVVLNFVTIFLSMADTFLNIVGVFLFIIFSYITIRTKFFINIKTKRKNEKKFD